MKKQPVKASKATPKTKKPHTMIGQMTLIITCVIVASFFVAGNFVLAQQYGLTPGCGGKTCQKTNFPSCWGR